MNRTSLRPDLIVATIEQLGQRIGERFPQSGLRDVCQEVLTIAQNMQDRAEWIARPVLWLRLLTWGVILLIVIVAWLPFYLAGQQTDDEVQALATTNVLDLIQIMEAGINDVVLIGAAIFFMLTLEARYKRQRASRALHELRSIAHVVDMHQLTKDPHRIMSRQAYPNTGRSPKMEMTRFELHRYLDYCSEMLALIGKIAAVYAQEFDDSDALAAASEIETLTTGLSRKIWQKIAIMTDIEQGYPVPEATPDKRSADLGNAAPEKAPADSPPPASP